MLLTVLQLWFCIFSACVYRNCFLRMKEEKLSFKERLCTCGRAQPAHLLSISWSPSPVNLLQLFSHPSLDCCHSYSVTWFRPLLHRSSPARLLDGTQALVHPPSLLHPVPSPVIQPLQSISSLPVRQKKNPVNLTWPPCLRPATLTQWMYRRGTFTVEGMLCILSWQQPNQPGCFEELTLIPNMVVILKSDFHWSIVMTREPLESFTVLPKIGTTWVPVPFAVGPCGMNPSGRLKSEQNDGELWPFLGKREETLTLSASVQFRCTLAGCLEAVQLSAGGKKYSRHFARIHYVPCGKTARVLLGKSFPQF